MLIATAGGLLISLWTGYEGAKLGVVPTGGLPGLPGDLPWLRLPSLLVPGLVIAVVGFAETTSIAQSFAAKDRRPWDPSRDFFGQGIANVVAGFSGGFPVGGSFTRSSLNRMSGARTRWSGAVTGLVVLMFLPFASVLAPLPRAVLAGIVISAVATLIEVGDLVRIWKFSKPQAVVGWTTFLITLALVPRLEQAVLMGVLLALGVHLWRERDMKLQTWSAEGALHLAPRGVLWFGTAPEMEKAISHAFGETVDLREVVFHLGGVGRLDFTGGASPRASHSRGPRGRPGHSLRRRPPPRRTDPPAGLRVDTVRAPRRAQLRSRGERPKGRLPVGATHAWFAGRSSALSLIG